MDRVAGKPEEAPVIEEWQGTREEIAFLKSLKNRGEVKSQSLLGASGVLRIRHASGVYQLRETQTGKLILTK